MEEGVGVRNDYWNEWESDSLVFVGLLLQVVKSDRIEGFKNVVTGSEMDRRTRVPVWSEGEFWLGKE